MAKISKNDIQSLQDDWGLDARNGFPYSGRAVQSFIKKYLSLANNHEKEKSACIGFKNMVVYLFASKEDKAQWEITGEELWIDSVPIVISGKDKKIQITNEYGVNPYFTVAQEENNLILSFESLEKEFTAKEWEPVVEDAIFTVLVDKGVTGKWVVAKENILVKHGTKATINIKDFLTIGENRVTVQAIGSSSDAEGTLNITANLTSMYLAPAEFAWYKPFIEGEKYDLGGLTIGGNVDKTLRVAISKEGSDNVEYQDFYIGIEQHINIPYFIKDFTFPSEGTGVYKIEMWLTAPGIESEHLVYNIMCISEADKDTAQLIALSNIASKVYNYIEDNKLFDFAIYDRGKELSSPQIFTQEIIEGEEAEPTIEVLNNITTSKSIPYTTDLKIEYQGENFQLRAGIILGETIREVLYPIDNTYSYPPVAGAVFYLNPSNRNNNQGNRESIINDITKESINAEWEKMAWSEGIDGWTIDDEGRKCLFIPARSKCIIDYSPLASATENKTIELTYKVKNAADYTEPVITIKEDVIKGSKETFKGIQITPDNILLHSNNKFSLDLQQGLNLQDEVTLHIIVTIIRKYKTTYGNLCQIYVNGIKARSFEFENDDSWESNAKIVLGSQTADLYIYTLRDYNKGFEKENSEKNYINSLTSPEDKTAMFELINNIRYIDIQSNKSSIHYDNVYGKFNTMEVEMLDNAKLPQHGLLKEYSAYCNVEFKFVDLPNYYKEKVWNFILKNCKIEGQGTTSMNYWLWNLRFRIDKSGDIVIIYPDGQEIILN